MAALLVICTVSAALLAAVHGVTKETIEQAQRQARLDSMMAVLPEETESCVEVTVKDESAVCFRAVDKENNTVAYAVQTTEYGYGGAISVMTGVALDGSVIAVNVYDNSAETPGLGAKTSESAFTSQFAVGSPVQGFVVSKDKTANDDLEEIDAVTGATISSRAVVSAVTHALGVARTAMEESNE